MEKPIALTNAQLDELLVRLAKGWVIRPDQTLALIAMAQELNALRVGAPTSAAISGMM